MSVPTASPRRVLVVDDNVDSAACVTELLQMLGHECRYAVTGQEALAIFATYAPEIVLLDLGLPDLSGFEVAGQMRAIGAGRPLLIVALTGWDQAADRERSAAAGMDLHAVKPASLETLQEIMATELPPRT